MATLETALRQLNQATTVVGAVYADAGRAPPQVQQQAAQALGAFAARLSEMEARVYRAAAGQGVQIPAPSTESSGTFAAACAPYLVPYALGTANVDLASSLNELNTAAGKMRQALAQASAAAATQGGGFSAAPPVAPAPAPQPYMGGAPVSPELVAMSPAAALAAAQADAAKAEVWMKRVAVLGGVLQTGVAAWTAWQVYRDGKRRRDLGILDEDDDEPMAIAAATQQSLDIEAPGHRVEIKPRPDGQWQAAALDRKGVVVARRVAEKPNLAAAGVLDDMIQASDSRAIDVKAERL